VQEPRFSFHLFFDPAGVGRIFDVAIRGVSSLRSSTPGYLLASLRDAPRRPARTRPLRLPPLPHATREEGATERDAKKQRA